MTVDVQLNYALERWELAYSEGRIPESFLHHPHRSFLCWYSRQRTLPTEGRGTVTLSDTSHPLVPLCRWWPSANRQPTVIDAIQWIVDVEFRVRELVHRCSGLSADIEICWAEKWGADAQDPIAQSMQMCVQFAAIMSAYKTMYDYAERIRKHGEMYRLDESRKPTVLIEKRHAHVGLEHMLQSLVDYGVKIHTLSQSWCVLQLPIYPYEARIPGTGNTCGEIALPDTTGGGSGIAH